jgi:hypothetical protein
MAPQPNTFLGRAVSVERGAAIEVWNRPKKGTRLRTPKGSREVERHQLAADGRRHSMSRAGVTSACSRTQRAVARHEQDRNS